jgi:alkylation response protein AidB-like acyl-CoA dehydrogenase
MMRVIEVIAEADGSTGWNLMIGLETMGVASGYLRRPLLLECPSTVCSGSVNPLGRARRTAGGFRVSGRWPYASGCTAADWFWGGCTLIDESGNPRAGPRGWPVTRQALIPRHDYHVVETWQVAGLRGSGSHDVVAEDVFVPDELFTDATGARPWVDTPLFRLPFYSRLAFNKVPVATGIARAAIDAFTDLASAKTPFTSRSLLRDRTSAQLAVARAEALVRSARAYVAEAVGSEWDTVLRGDKPSLEQRAHVRLACSQAVQWCIEAVTLVHGESGITANFRSSPFARRFADVHVVAQHVMSAPTIFEPVGRTLLGLDPGTPIF